MSEAQMLVEPLRLDDGWRLPEQSPDQDGVGNSANVHPLRVISGEGRSSFTVGRDELRSMVREVLREELRAEFGQRITRTVRQLVRDELAQIFARIGGR